MLVALLGTTAGMVAAASALYTNVFIRPLPFEPTGRGHLVQVRDRAGSDSARTLGVSLEDVHRFERVPAVFDVVLRERRGARSASQLW